MQRIAVEPAGRRYDVVVDAGGLERASSYIERLAQDRRLFVIADSGAYAAQGDRLRAGLAPLELDEITVDLGEDRKRLEVVEQLAEKLHCLGADRSSLVIALGGGVAGDVAGFVAASYMRGIDFIQIPTTLLAQVDASVGGKTGVNLASGKNLVGAFHQPLLVLIDPQTLNSLPDREYRAGLFEVIKHGIIRSRDLFDFMDEYRENVIVRQPAALERIISESVRIKADVVRQDEREGDLRPHAWPRSRSRNRLQALSARRGDRLGHGRRGPAGRIAGDTVRHGQAKDRRSDSCLRWYPEPGGVGSHKHRCADRGG